MYPGIPESHTIHLVRDGHVRLSVWSGIKWDVPWDPRVPHGTFGMGCTCGTECVEWDAMGCSDVPWDPRVPHGTLGTGWTCETECVEWDPMGCTMGSQSPTWYQVD